MVTMGWSTLSLSRNILNALWNHIFRVQPVPFGPPHRFERIFGCISSTCLTPSTPFSDRRASSTT